MPNSPTSAWDAAFRRAGSVVAGMPANLAASLLLIAAFATFSWMAVMIRTINTTIPIVEVVFVRQLLAMAVLAPAFWRARVSIQTSSGLKLHLARGVSATGSMICGLTATVLIPLADVTAIQMAEVLIVTVLAALLLREQVGWRRWLATAVGFAGVIIMVRPFGSGVSPYALIALAGAFFGALNMLFVRAGAGHDRIETVLFWQGIVVLSLVAPMTVAVWVTPTWAEAGLLVIMSLVFTLGLWLVTAAFRMGETSALAPLHYLRLILMGLVGWTVYGELPTIHTIIGAALVLTAATYTIRRNAQKLPGKPQVVASPPH